MEFKFTISIGDKFAEGRKLCHLAKKTMIIFGAIASLHNSELGVLDADTVACFDTFREKKMRFKENVAARTTALS